MQLFKDYHTTTLFVIFFLVFTGSASAQTDSAKAVSPETVSAVKSSDTVTAPKTSKKSSKKVDTYIFYGGININNLNGSSSTYESASGTGWHLGASYRRGNFFFWQVGARFSDAKYKLTLKNKSSADSTADDFSVADLDIPITAGINLLPITKRIFNIHVFVSAAPSFQLSVADNKLGITKDNTNTFKLYGQAGVGFDILFLVLDLGYNYGFIDLMDNADSKPGQIFLNLGFRF
jgi:hypothetical protein